MTEEKQVSEKSLKRAKSSIILGIIGLVINLLPIMSAWFLVISWTAWIFEILAIIFGILALLDGEKKNSIIGIVVAVVSILVPFIFAKYYLESTLESAGSMFEMINSLE